MTASRKLARRQRKRARAIERNPGLAVRLVEGVQRERRRASPGIRAWRDAGMVSKRSYESLLDGVVPSPGAESIVVRTSWEPSFCHEIEAPPPFWRQP